VATSDTSSQTAQSNTTQYAFDIWADMEKAVKALLSPEAVWWATRLPAQSLFGPC
jgi:hypothetical protein